MSQNRLLTRSERIEARHILQELSESARSVRNAVDPQHGMLAIHTSQWRDQYRSLIAALEFFTCKVSQDGLGKEDNT